MIEKPQINNSNSVISLTLGILSIIIPYIGLILGAIGVVVSRKATKEIIKTDEGGSGLATSGLICSVVGIITQLFLVVSIIAFYFLTNVG
ncbi:DUF4190 domain-containing protein [Psychrobacillus sp. NPDC096426]|uniref:DUF4190 domain-containing protein n=1 Tax=Psychrobacillus sp. NPDC096426 TaxID=3364491 RepID=UPI0038096E74